MPGMPLSYVEYEPPVDDVDDIITLTAATLFLL